MAHFRRKLLKLAVRSKFSLHSLINTHSTNLISKTGKREKKKEKEKRVIVGL